MSSRCCSNGCWVEDGCWLNGGCWPNGGCSENDGCWVNGSCWLERYGWLDNGCWLMESGCWASGFMAVEWGALLYGQVIWDWGKVCCLIQRDSRNCWFLQQNQPNQVDISVSRILGQPQPLAWPPPHLPQLSWPPLFSCDADGPLRSAVWFLLVASSVFSAHT